MCGFEPEAPARKSRNIIPRSRFGLNGDCRLCADLSPKRQRRNKKRHSSLALFEVALFKCHGTIWTAALFRRFCFLIFLASTHKKKQKRRKSAAVHIRTKSFPRLYLEWLISEKAQFQISR